jgi:putative SOS response-associated peptidase YedK
MNFKTLADHVSCPQSIIHTEQQGFLIGGILFNSDEGARFVVLTTEATPQCAAVNHRMPIVIDRADMNTWFYESPEDVQGLAIQPTSAPLRIEPVDGGIQTKQAN